MLNEPSLEAWPLRQVYVHLINSTLHFHLQQVKTCLENVENSDKKIKVPPSEFYTVKQHESKEELIKELLNKVKAQMKLTLPKLKDLVYLLDYCLKDPQTNNKTR